jgi:hypothetical protein
MKKYKSLLETIPYAIKTQIKYVVRNGEEVETYFKWKDYGYTDEGFDKHLNSTYKDDIKKILIFCKKNKLDAWDKKGGIRGGSRYICIDKEGFKGITVRCANHLPGKDQEFLYDRKGAYSKNNYSNDGINGSLKGAFLFIKKAFKIK